MNHNKYLDKLPIALSSAGLGLGVANFINSRRSSKNTQEQKRIEQQSLNALKAIHQTIAAPTSTPIVKI